MQELWGTFEFIALAILFVLQIYFLIIALRKMKLMRDFFPDIKFIHIKRIVVDEKGNESKISSDTSPSMIHENKPNTKPSLSIQEMKSLKPNELRPYIKFLSRAYWSRIVSDYCMSTEHLVAAKDAIVAIKPSQNDYSDFVPSKRFTVDEFKIILSQPNVYANRLYEVVNSNTESSSNEIRVLSAGKCVEDGTRWKIINKCRISL